jgi:hypothetical protein
MGPFLIGLMKCLNNARIEARRAEDPGPSTPLARYLSENEDWSQPSLNAVRSKETSDSFKIGLPEMDVILTYDARDNSTTNKVDEIFTLKIMLNFDLGEIGLDEGLRFDMSNISEMEWELVCVGEISVQAIASCRFVTTRLIQNADQTIAYKTTRRVLHVITDIKYTMKLKEKSPKKSGNVAAGNIVIRATAYKLKYFNSVPEEPELINVKKYTDVNLLLEEVFEVYINSKTKTKKMLHDLCVAVGQTLPMTKLNTVFLYSNPTPDQLINFAYGVALMLNTLKLLVIRENSLPISTELQAAIEKSPSPIFTFQSDSLLPSVELRADDDYIGLLTLQKTNKIPNTVFLSIRTKSLPANQLVTLSSAYNIDVTLPTELYMKYTISKADQEDWVIIFSAYAKSNNKEKAKITLVYERLDTLDFITEYVFDGSIARIDSECANNDRTYAAKTLFPKSLPAWKTKDSSLMRIRRYSPSLSDVIKGVFLNEAINKQNTVNIRISEILDAVDTFTYVSPNTPNAASTPTKNPNRDKKSASNTPFDNSLNTANTSSTYSETSNPNNNSFDTAFNSSSIIDLSSDELPVVKAKFALMTKARYTAKHYNAFLE